MNIKQLLQDADPLRIELEASDIEMTLRNAFEKIDALASVPHHPIKPSRLGRRMVIAACILIAGLSLVSALLWPLIGHKAHPPARFELRLAEEYPAPGLHEANIEGKGRTVYLHDELLATNVDLVRAYVGRDDSGVRYGINLDFTAEAGRRMMAATQAHIGGTIALLIDRKVLIVERINGRCNDACTISTNDLTKSELEHIVAKLK